MINIDKIRQEIERRKKENMDDDLPTTIGRYYEDRDLLAFIDSLSEEPTNDIERENTIKAVLECRLTIVRLSLNKYNPSPEQRLYLEGKAEGYQQAIGLLNATDKSIGIEL